MSIDMIFSKARISKIVQSEGFLGSLLSKLAGPLIKVALPLAKNILASLGIIAAASAIDAETQKNIHGWGRPLSSSPRTTTLTVSNKK